MITHILLFFLITAGIFLLTKGIKYIRKSTGGSILLDIPMEQTDARLTISKDGNYAIWQKGRNINRTAVSMPQPAIYNEQTKESLTLQVPFAVVRTNNGSNGRIRIYTFWAPVGQYRYQLSEDSAGQVSWLQKLRSNDRINPAQCFIEIKESLPASLLLIGILITILSAVMIIAALVILSR